MSNTAKNATLENAMSVINDLLRQITKMRGMRNENEKSIAKSVERAERLQQAYERAQEIGTIQKRCIIGPSDSARYNHKENPRGPDFSADVYDRFKSNGRLFVDIKSKSGKTDDALRAMIEVAAHPETGQPVPVVHLHSGDACIADVYANGKGKAIVLMPHPDFKEALLRHALLRAKKEWETMAP